MNCNLQVFIFTRWCRHKEKLNQVSELIHDSWTFLKVNKWNVNSYTREDEP